MIVSFVSIADENNKIEFTAKAEVRLDEIIFEDKSMSNTMISIKHENSSIILKRFGATNMLMEYRLGCLTSGYYRNNEGIDFEFEIYTRYLKVGNDKYSVSYDMIVENEIVSKISFELNFLENQQIM